MPKLNYLNKLDEKLFPKVKEELRNNKINYLEENGNAYINCEDIFIYIDTNKATKQQKEKGNRAFTKTGLFKIDCLE